MSALMVRYPFLLDADGTSVSCLLSIAVIVITGNVCCHVRWFTNLWIRDILLY